MDKLKSGRLPAVPMGGKNRPHGDDQDYVPPLRRQAVRAAKYIFVPHGRQETRGKKLQKAGALT